MAKIYELIVIGGGLIGLSTAYNATSFFGGHTTLNGKDVLVLEQSSFFNQLSSSAEASRQFRFQYDDDFMTQMVIDSTPEWKRLQKQTVTELISYVGSLWFGDPTIPTTEGGINSTINTMKRMGIPYQYLTAKEIEAWYQFKNIPDNYIGFFQANGGIINLPATLRTLYNVSHNNGVHFKEYNLVTKIESDGCNEVIVTTNKEIYHGKKIVMAVGPYTNKLISPLGTILNLEIWDMVSAYFRKKNPKINYPTWFAFQKPNAKNSNLYYGFPEAPWKNPGYIKVAPDYPFKIYDSPEQRTPPTKSDFEGTNQWVKNHMEYLDPEPKFTSTCMLAMPKDDKPFYLDSLPGHSNIVVYTSGWGAKFTPLLGKICAQLAINGHTFYDVTPFKI
ncbi:FAD-dependent oxidoreductase [Photorhabdus akhurstii]|uniref:FAD-dependent oxidoreductase n=1 Tax=Photorhabdus akhurstii TaxID=171438 RepID=UPI000D4F6F9D|nr:FAD-dependent oxidoreductase [Photorhabdus akhurstii]MBS9427684.1 FAD-dependent oxidoreductase [Photorhabdus akhurstii]PQQ41590.1 FAD-dependent oxidoreductase [Photorhabdus luminescens]